MIRSLKSNTLTGLDGLQVNVVKSLIDEITPAATTTINKILETENFPKALKTSLVTPILKSGNAQDITNYRPISVIGNLAKVVEKIIKIRLNNYLNKQNYV